MGAITISRQQGCQGDELARQVADRLGWQVVSRDLINQAAKEAGVPAVALAEIDELDLFGLKTSAREWQAYYRQVDQIITDLADEGQVVIVGRGGQMTLSQRLDVLHVRMIAPFEKRLARLQAMQRLSEPAARARLLGTDQARQRFLQRSHQADLEDPTLYHLILNSGLLSIPQAVSLVVKAYRELTGEPVPVPPLPPERP